MLKKIIEAIGKYIVKFSRRMTISPGRRKPNFSITPYAIRTMPPMMTMSAKKFSFMAYQAVKA